MQFQIEIEDTDAALIAEWLTQHGRPEFCSHGSLDMPGLARMLLEDVALSVRRPGSWEGANMMTVLESHGYC